jgi:hypothetical protein
MFTVIKKRPGQTAIKLGPSTRSYCELLGYQKYLKCHGVPRDLKEDGHGSCAKMFCIFIIILNAKPRNLVANVSFEFMTVWLCFRKVPSPNFRSADQLL